MCDITKTIWHKGLEQSYSKTPPAKDGKTVESRNTCHSEAAPVGIVPRCIGVQKRRLGGPAGPRRQCQPSRAGKHGFNGSVLAARYAFWGGTWLPNLWEVVASLHLWQAGSSHEKSNFAIPDVGQVMSFKGQWLKLTSIGSPTKPNLPFFHLVY